MSAPLDSMPTAAVMVAHGPTGASLTTLRRMTELVNDGQVHVVAGTEPGLTAVQRAAERGHAVVSDHGPAALADLLSTMDGVVLVMHDDVEITAQAVANMADAHRRTGLPAIADGRSRVAQRRVDRTHLVCVVGDAADLAERARASAFGPGHVTTGPFVVAAAAPMSHLGECQKRLVERDGPDEGPLLVAALVVRDEADDIDACLRSLEGVVDRIEVADTGSVDATASMARELGANVIEIDWREDFAWARNQVLDRCRDARYVIWIDADERFVCDDPEQLRRLLRTYHRLYPSYRIEIHNLAKGVETHTFAAKRIVDPAGVHFEGALHEQARRIDGSELLEVGLTLCSLDHHGYEESVVDKRKKLERNLQIARESFEVDPIAEHAVHYARSLKAASTDPVATLEEIDPLLPIIERTAPPIRSMMAALRADLMLAAGADDAAVDAAIAALELVPGDNIAGAVLAEALVRLGRPADALATAADFGSRTSTTPVIVDHTAARTRAHALFDAACAVGDIDAAQAWLPDLPADADPWTAFGTSFGTEALVQMADRAGAKDDQRYLRKLLARPDVVRSQVVAARDRFAAVGGQVADDLVDAVLGELALVDDAPRRRTRFEESGDAADARSYVEALVVGHLDLGVELETAAAHRAPVAATLAVGAEAWRRRGRHDAARRDAEDSWRHEPTTQAAIVLAEQQLTDGDAAAALSVADAAIAAGALEDAPRARRHELLNLAVDAHLETNDLAGAIGRALEIIDDRGKVDAWPALLQIAIEDTEKLSLVLGLALLSDGGDFIAAAASTLRPDTTSELCAAYLTAGGRNPNAVSTGILAAVLKGRQDLAQIVADHGALLPPDVGERLSDHVADAGAAEVARKLREACDGPTIDASLRRRSPV